MTDRLTEALTELTTEDPELGRLAEGIVDWLTSGEGEETIDLAGVQRFAWYELPMKWMESTEEHKRTLEAAAVLFDRLEMPRYAEVCSSEETAAILDAYEESIDRGKQMFRRACRRSGIDPPDLDDFEWSAVMGMEEATALGNAERALERATADGRLESRVVAGHRRSSRWPTPNDARPDLPKLDTDRTSRGLAAPGGGNKPSAETAPRGHRQAAAPSGSPPYRYGRADDSSILASRLP